MGLGAGIGGALGAVGSVVGGIIGNSMSSSSAAQLNQQNYERQKEFAQQGIRWRVADAKAAGLHPLAALGAQGAMYTPSGHIGGTDTSFIGDAAAQFGQGIERAVSAKQQRAERLRTQAIQDQKLALDMQTSRAQTALLDAQTAQIKQDMALQLARSSARAIANQQQVPAMPGGSTPVVSGQAQAYPTANTEEKPVEVSSSLPGALHQQAGLNPDVKWRKTATGYRVAMSDQAKTDNEDDIWGTIQWTLDNRVAPIFSSFSRSGVTPPSSWLPPGHEWVFYPASGEFRPKKRKSRGQTIYVGN